MKSNKMYSVKGFSYETIEDLKNKTLKLNLRHVIVLGKNLSWEQAKKMRKENKDSSIFPNVVDTNLKVVQLSPLK
jgi:hypothetical protein